MLFIAALAADAYIYRSLIVPRFIRLPARIVYLLLAIVTDVAALSGTMLYRSPAEWGSVGIVVVMWVMWVFCITFVPKVCYVVGSLLDRFAGVVARRRVSIFMPLGLAVSVVAVAAMVWGATWGRTAHRVATVDICSPRVPAAFDGYRIVQISDLHIGTMMNPARQLAPLVEAINAQNADMVLFTGDMTSRTHDELTDRVIALLRQVTAPDGVWAALGNHDLGFYIRGGDLTPQANLDSLARKTETAGWTILSDRSTWIRRGGDSILLSGIDYPRDPMLNSNNQILGGVDVAEAFTGIAGDPFNIVMSHTPRQWDVILGQGRGDLTLAGHVHAMQIKLQIGSWRWSPAQYMYRQWSGRYDTINCGKKSVLYVNDGIGCGGYPMRIGARGEITVITLKQCE